ncbi:acyl-CoA reductase [Paenibacillus sp. NFR01]|uniref:acyl-CoA reductase n=1 Tax=Paenibacillus sp. NFR01 TaxID=1566279 RepID=UPI0008CBB2C0|nr:acyl-CoA reductase [Paenibacillus sp. NFR01]SEU10090.1 Acyl-CoA reductase (LuxC) [Paenibacillus sp. NFR01]
MQIIIPKKLQDSEWRAQINKVANRSNSIPFDATTVKFLEALSKSILLDRTMRAYPELMATAHWLRKSHIMELQKRFEQFGISRHLRPRGTVIHFAPANVDSIFVYSWILSMLTGNKNIVRLSRRNNPQTEILFDKINALLEQELFVEIADRTLLVRYNHEEEYTQALSDICQLRVIWGGDQSVRSIRACSLPPSAVELVFPNRYSKAIIQASSVNELEDAALDDLSKKFYNDALWFGQMACSSPREVYWIGESEEVEMAKAKFWEFVDRTIDKEGYKNETYMNVLRLTTADFLAAQDYSDHVFTEGAHKTVRVGMNAIHGEYNTVHCGGGLFLEYQIHHINELTEAINESVQTLSYFGISKDQLVDFMNQLPHGGVDRIVPFGQALHFDSVWDGYDLLVYLTREVIIN